MCVYIYVYIYVYTVYVIFESMNVYVSPCQLLNLVFGDYFVEQRPHIIDRRSSAITFTRSFRLFANKKVWTTSSSGGTLCPGKKSV